MADEKKNPLGSTGEQVRRNVERLREARGLTKKDLADRTRNIGRPIPALGISRIEAGTRRVDADDLIALALVLNVSPLTLLLPPTSTAVPVELTEGYTVASHTAWNWGEGFQTAMDFPSGEGVNLAAPGADPAIALEVVEREEEFKRRQIDYTALAQPKERQRGVSNPAVRLARDLADLVTDLVAPEPGVDRAGMAARSRMAWRRHQQLGMELEGIAESLPPVHPGVPMTESIFRAIGDDLTPAQAEALQQSSDRASGQSRPQDAADSDE